MGAIQLKTAVPGPKSQLLAQRSARAVARGIAQVTPIFVERAEGAVIEDVDGNRFLDLAGGIGCLNVGHRNREVVAALRKQLDRFLHTCFMVTPYESYVALAEKLNALAPGNFPKKTILVNTGAEAVENAVKIARAYTRRPSVICFEDGFHGRTLLTLSLTSKTHPYKAGFEPFATDIYRVPYAYCYRCSYNLRYPSCKIHCAHHLEDTFKRIVAAESVAAIIAEPVLGEGGFVAPPLEWLGIVQDICRRHGILLIADEVQTGFGRTGKFFACEHSGVEPDLIASAKSLGGGLPIAAVTGKAEIMDNTGPGSLGGTFGGNPLACEAALAAIRAIEQERLNDRAVVLGERFHARALKWRDRFPFVGDVRGLGAMQAFEVVQPDGSRQPNPEATKTLVRYCYEHGLIFVTAGTYNNVIRVLMPLVITDDQMDEGLDVLDAALTTVAGAGETAVAEAKVPAGAA
ncbi:MAG TPA: 4-aminobutyrate--2-oxoglutarate transaminase [Bryobacteraceae bacterium]|jgi:4-aminobutyrate aminotransferase/(S)-3-amino-2-methylpropionate transaminase|nr:4-aminobutyrate--2-oxoglutarate transaminase [Bryobacteraceae bacterium]